MTDQSDEPVSPPAPTPQERRPQGDSHGTGPTHRRGRLRRRPKVVPFLVTGAVLGLIVGVVLPLVVSDDPGYGGVQGTIVLGLLFAMLGGLVGGVAFVLADRRSAP